MLITNYDANSTQRSPVVSLQSWVPMAGESQ